MAESILFGVAERIIGTLATSAVQETGLLWGVNEELSGLEDTISLIKAVLVDAEEKKAHNHHVKAWLTRLEDVVYEADDLLDEFSAEDLRQQILGSTGSEMTKMTLLQVCNFFFSTPNQFAFKHKMGQKIKAVKEKLDAIRVDRCFYLEVRNEEAKVVYRSREHTHSFVSQEEVVIGRDGDRLRILECLLDNETDENDLVIPIVGSGGLGKTTLARLVFNDDEVQKHFDLKMWVCVSSTNFDVRLLVEKILRSGSDSERFENSEMESLQKELRQKIGGKRYLLVLDDVWNENRELWLSLRTLLLNGAKGSRIIVTTRSKVVAKIMSKRKPYLLGRLDETQSWSLFRKMAFAEEQDATNSNIVEVGKKIVKKCGGIPLAIRTIGRMLYFKSPETEWSSFHDVEFLNISQDENDILPTLELSYNHLPSHLKHCFAYCSLFPKDHEINVKDLINLWMAQGFLKSTNTAQSLEDVGHEYFMELYWKLFFQEVEEDAFGDIKKCKMHDLIHDLAIQVAGLECVMLPSDRKNVKRNTHHVSFNFCLKSSRQIPTSLSQTSNRIRTILLPSQPWWGIEETAGAPICDVIISNFKFLRMLDLHNSGIKIVPESIGKLKHLRYLDLSKQKSRCCLIPLPSYIICKH
ncbi:putative disease resistance protein RGA4 isoform X1 [Ziziphus jujuba]|uniref:Disease resistance protein RGA4 isoform X1 n=1 Tax=Ziziphus jujuba TaxID=326968 RepID=A0ABM3IKW1_ZIZJJ|nr:putative disease resistance protein RGA4 isoform X1 [Ziziphus jujuba]